MHATAILITRMRMFFSARDAAARRYNNKGGLELKLSLRTSKKKLQWPSGQYYLASFKKSFTLKSTSQ